MNRLTWSLIALIFALEGTAEAGKWRRDKFPIKGEVVWYDPPPMERNPAFLTPMKQENPARLFDFRTRHPGYPLINMMDPNFHMQPWAPF